MTTSNAQGQGSLPAYYKPAKLTATQRDEIGYRRHEGEGPMALAAEYGVSSQTIHNCVKKPRP